MTLSYWQGNWNTYEVEFRNHVWPMLYLKFVKCMLCYKWGAISVRYWSKHLWERFVDKIFWFLTSESILLNYLLFTLLFFKKLNSLIFRVFCLFVCLFFGTLSSPEISSIWKWNNVESFLCHANSKLVVHWFIQEFYCLKLNLMPFAPISLVAE